MSGKVELRLFDEPLPQIAVESAYFVDITPSTSITESANKLEFIIHGSESDYLDLNDTMLYLKLKVVQADMKALATTSAIAPVNYMLNAIFSDVTLSLNDTVIEGGNQMYAYKSTIETIFGFNREAKEVKLQAMGYEEDVDKRKPWIAGSEEMELAGSVRLDFFNQPKYLLPNVNVRLIFSRSKDMFALCGGGTGSPKLILLDAKLYVRRVRVAADIIMAHEKGLVKKNAIYPYTRSQTISYSIPQNSLSHYRDNIFSSSLLPKFVIVGFVKASAFNGTNLNLEPFHFDHFNVQSVGLFRDGQALPYREIYQPRFKEKLVLKDFMKSIIHGTQHLNTNLNNGILLSDFLGGKYSLFTFNLTPDFDMNQTQLPKDGNLRLEIQFAEALTTPINVIVYGMFDTQILITKERQVVSAHVY